MCGDDVMHSMPPPSALGARFPCMVLELMVIVAEPVEKQRMPPPPLPETENPVAAWLNRTMLPEMAALVAPTIAIPPPFPIPEPIGPAKLLSIVLPLIVSEPPPVA